MLYGREGYKPSIALTLDPQSGLAPPFGSKSISKMTLKRLRETNK